MTHLKLQIPDMHCPSCAMKLMEIEDELPGIIKIVTSYHGQSLDVEYDEFQVSEGEIRRAVEKLGYTAKPD